MRFFLVTLPLYYFTLHYSRIEISTFYYNENKYWIMSKSQKKSTKIVRFPILLLYSKKYFVFVLKTVFVKIFVLNF